MFLFRGHLAGLIVRSLVFSSIMNKSLFKENRDIKKFCTSKLHLTRSMRPLRRSRRLFKNVGSSFPCFLRQNCPTGTKKFYVSGVWFLVG
jgi:hypothetical protein